MLLMALHEGPQATQHRGTAAGLVVRCSGTALPKNLTTSPAAVPMGQLAVESHRSGPTPNCSCACASVVDAQLLGASFKHSKTPQTETLWCHHHRTASQQHPAAQTTLKQARRHKERDTSTGLAAPCMRKPSCW